jgi:hypothetical protein
MLENMNSLLKNQILLKIMLALTFFIFSFALLMFMTVFFLFLRSDKNNGIIIDDKEKEKNGLDQPVPPWREVDQDRMYTVWKELH